MLDRSTPPPVHMMGDLSLPNQKIETLPNGLVLHSFSGGSQDVNQLSLVWPGGTSEAPSPSVARILALTLREGTSSLTGTEISEALDFNGAMVRVAADSHFTVFTVAILNSKTSSILPLIRDIVTDATFPEPAFNTYREIELQEFRLQRSRVSVLSSEDLSLLIKGKDHPQAHVPTEEEIQAVTVDQVREYYRRVFTAAGCHAFLSGNLSDGVYAEIRDMLASLPAPSPAVDLDILPYEAQAPCCTKRQIPGFVQASVQMGIPAPSRQHPDYVPLRFTVTALGGYFGSRLMKNIREDKGYTYGINAYLIGSQEGGYMMISAQADKKYVDALIEEVKVELKKLASEPLSDDELIRLKQYISLSLMQTLDSPFSIMDFYRSALVVDFPDHYFADQVNTVHTISAETIMHMASRYLNPDHLRIAVVY